ncbi:DsbA family protein [Desulfovibrio litoralis]|uniref:Protein-disulfide isomerase n=1 Tax=Desulfovibrio litoralis DSM 11393 TaxID=1121455 RepID=A0A1M7RX25_9BACT|nr:thioredoxin domain-containing protein [Desulfovibrio litoralis]SHN50800.1 Protein-disulfide isomerase [Desulfovibrio litoralis DSM 11393]
MQHKTFLLLVFTIISFCYNPASAQNTANSITLNNQIKEAVKEVLKENPGLILDILKDNSELVFEIAQQGVEQRKRKVYAAKWQEDLKQPVKIDIKNRPIRGNINAPVTIVAFSDFTCPYCQKGAELIKNIMQNNAGKVRFVFKHFPLAGQGHENSRIASEYIIAAFMQDENKGWELYDTVFENRKDLINDGEKFLQASAKKLGLNVNKLTSDIKSRQVQALISADIAEAEKLGVQGTPYFFVNNLRIPGMLPEDLFSLAIDTAQGK